MEHKDGGSASFAYNGELLNLAKDLGDRLLPAFSSPTGIPYSRVSISLLRTRCRASLTKIPTHCWKRESLLALCFCDYVCHHRHSYACFMMIAITSSHISLHLLPCVGESSVRDTEGSNSPHLPCCSWYAPHGIR